MRSQVKEVEEIAKTIKRVMTDEGVYSPLYELAIYSLAQTTFLKNSVFEDAVAYKFPDIDEANTNSKGSSIIIEQSREGFLRYKNHPSYSLFLDYGEKELKILDSLKLTPKSSNTAQDDEIQGLTEGRQDILNGK